MTALTSEILQRLGTVDKSKLKLIKMLPPKYLEWAVDGGYISHFTEVVRNKRAIELITFGGKSFFCLHTDHTHELVDRVMSSEFDDSFNYVIKKDDRYVHIGAEHSFGEYNLGSARAGKYDGCPIIFRTTEAGIVDIVAYRMNGAAPDNTRYTEKDLKLERFETC